LGSFASEDEMKKLLFMVLGLFAVGGVALANDFNYTYPVMNEPFLEQWFRFYFDGITLGTQTASRVVTADSNSNVSGLGVLTTSIAGGATKTLTAANCNNVVRWDTLAGSVITLPAATGSGCHYRLYVSVLATSNSHILYTSSANAVGGTANNFVGLINGSRVDVGNAVLGFAAQATSNTITLNRTTTGSVSLGEYVDVVDVATSVWQVSGMLSATGAAFATPFSHT
jgi:hypothetical protein